MGAAAVPRQQLRPPATQPKKSRAKGRETAKAWLGVATQPVLKELAEQMGQKDAQGFRVTRVYPRTKAAESELRIGDVVIADRTIQHDAGVIEDAALQTYQAGHVPFINPTAEFGYATDPSLLARVRSHLNGFALTPLSRNAGGGGRLPRIAYGTVLTGDQYLHCALTRDRLHADLGGHAVEMEGAAVSQVCESFGIPWLVIRALSDLAGAQSRFDFSAFVDEVSAQSAAIVRHLLPVL